MPVIEKMFNEDTEEASTSVILCFHCPGCKYGHSFSIKGPGPNWTWNGDLEKPTFSPSLLVWQSRADQRCHSFVRDGQIQFLDDCAHNLRGQTVPLPPL